MAPRDWQNWEPRFWAKVDRRGSDDCWLWQATRSPIYGAFTRGGKQYRAHRIAYELLVGPIPAGLQLHHTCGQPICVNPAHLTAVTHATHMKIGGNALKTHCPRGHPLTLENLYVYEGKRSCKTCKIKQAKDRQARL